MKKTSLFALLAVAGSTTAFAAPRESITLTNVPSVTLQGNPANFTTTLVATGVDGGGAYNAASINVSGSVGNFRGVSWQREAMIRVTPPTGTPFIVAPGTLGAATAATYTSFQTIPVSAVTTAGTWTFEFFDDFEDASASGTNASEATLGGYDALWSTVTISLDDAAPAAASVGSGPSVSYTNVDSDGLAAAPAQTRSWVNGTAVPGSLPGVRVRGRVVSRLANTTSTALNQPGNARISFLPPGAATATTAWTADLALSSMGTVDTIVALPSGTATAGTWAFNFFEGNDIAGGVDNQWLDVSFELVDLTPVAPASEAVTLSDGNWVSDVETISGPTVKWYSITVPAIDTAIGSALDIDNVGSSLAPLNDTGMALYNNTTGAVIVTDALDGPGDLAQLSFGRGTRQAEPTGTNYAGGDGTLAAGTYLLAVSNGTLTANGSFQASTTATNTGSLTTRFRYYSNFVPVAPASENLGTLVANTPISDSEVVAVGGVKWYKFTLNETVSRATNRGLSIDNEGSTTTPVNDSWIALYTSAGAVRASDTADGSNSIAMLSFGADSRPANATPTVGLAYDGRDGTLVPDVYYVATSAGTAPTFGSGFILSGVSATAAAANLVTNISYISPGITVPAPTEPAGTIDVGNVGSATSPAEEVITRTLVGATGDAQFQWYKFTTTADASDTTGFYLDIDTEGTDPTNLVGGAIDTECGLYAANGLFLVTDDDDGSGLRTQFSFGDTAPVRPVVTTGTGASAPVARNGRDGVLPAGTYFFVLGFDATTYTGGTAQFVFTPPTTGTFTATDVLLNWRTNLPLAPTIVRCGPSDVAGANQSVGFDGQLTADDIIVFLGWYFGNDARADVAGPNQSTIPDDELSADDIIVFLARYFAGC